VRISILDTCAYYLQLDLVELIYGPLHDGEKIPSLLINLHSIITRHHLHALLLKLSKIDDISVKIRYIVYLRPHTLFFVFALETDCPSPLNLHDISLVKYNMAVDALVQLLEKLILIGHVVACTVAELPTL
jgi:hypothetical protein